MIGSSPLTRGIQIRRCHPLQGLRFIPAHAGNTPCLLSDVQVLEVHPRSRGEYRLLMPLILTSVGSSPLTRGIQWLGFDGSRLMVHPRSRGEYYPHPRCLRLHLGSSPLTRGIQNPGHIRAYSDGFIPAHAGNTLKKALFYLTFSNTHFHISFNF